MWKLPKQTDSCYPVCAPSRLNLSPSLLGLKSCPRSLLAGCLQICCDHFEAPSRRPWHCDLRFLSPGTKTCWYWRLNIGRMHSVSMVWCVFRSSGLLISASHPRPQLCRQKARMMSQTTSTQPLPLCQSKGKKRANGWCIYLGVGGLCSCERELGWSFASCWQGQHCPAAHVGSAGSRSSLPRAMPYQAD